MAAYKAMVFYPNHEQHLISIKKDIACKVVLEAEPYAKEYGKTLGGVK